MLLTIIAIWAIVLPLVILAIGWHVSQPGPASGSPTPPRSAPRPATHTGSLPACARRAPRPRRTITRRVCPEHGHGAGRRQASA